MFETICDINRLNYSDPLFYTEQYLRNKYVKANDLAKHIHLFNHQISRIDYALFGGLKGEIRKLTEIETEKIADGATRSNPAEIKKTVFVFNRNLELNQVLIIKDGLEETMLFSESLKTLKTLQIIKSFDQVKSSQTDISYNNFLAYESIDEENFSNGERSHWVNQNQRNTKYVFKQDGLIHKIHMRNNGGEQSRNTIVYNSNFQILESKAYSQKDKTELLYEAVFEYGKNVLKKIIYVRHQPSKAYGGNWTQELVFEYNEKGLLVEFLDDFTKTTWTYDQHSNPVSVKEFDKNGSCLSEIATNYEYDNHDNWISKTTKKMIGKVEKSSKQVAREIEYF